jgi:hypothetical protein
MKTPLALMIAVALLPAVCRAENPNRSIRIGTVADNRDVNWVVAEDRGGATVTAAPVFGAVTFGNIAGLTIPFTDNDGYWTAQASFTIPAGATNTVLHLETFGVDDRAVVALNGRLITSSGTYSGGNGYMTLHNNGPNLPFTFAYGSGAEDLQITTGFLPGINKLQVIVNNTNEGILGVPVPVTPYSPSSFGLTGEVIYTPPAVE